MSRTETWNLQTLVDIFTVHTVGAQFKARLADAFGNVPFLFAFVGAVVIFAEIHIALVWFIHVVATVIDTVAHVLERNAFFRFHLTGELVFRAGVVRRVMTAFSFVTAVQAVLLVVAHQALRYASLVLLALELVFSAGVLAEQLVASCLKKKK